MTAPRPAASAASAGRHTVTASPYSRFARAYAAGAERTFSQAMAKYALAQATADGRACRAVLDLACGIGAACEFFAETGLRVTGADVSGDMIRQANDAASARGLRVTYARQDMRHVSVPEPADLATCMYDSLNFMLTESDLLNAFTAARTCVRAGGTYVFDVYSPHGLATAWGPKEQVHTATDNHFVATRTTRNDQAGTHTKEFWGFDREGNQWDAWTEAHMLRAYMFPAIRELLRRAGFVLADAAGWADHHPVPWSDMNERWVITARSPERAADTQEQS
jgi:SAM-dependent methyltransferase